MSEAFRLSRGETKILVMDRNMYRTRCSSAQVLRRGSAQTRWRATACWAAPRTRKRGAGSARTRRTSRRCNASPSVTTRARRSRISHVTSLPLPAVVERTRSASPPAGYECCTRSIHRRSWLGPATASQRRGRSCSFIRDRMVRLLAAGPGRAAQGALKLAVMVLPNGSVSGRWMDPAFIRAVGQPCVGTTEAGTGGAVRGLVATALSLTPE